MSNAVRLGLVGLGTVGTGVLEMLKKNRALVESKIGAPLEIAMICDRSAAAADVKKLGVPAAFTRDAYDVVSNPNVDIFVELIGGYEPARTLLLRALDSGKH